MRTPATVAVLLLGLATSATADDPADLFQARVFKDEDGKTLPYRLLKPESVEDGQKYPLVLFLHGAGERGDDNAAQLKNGVQEFAKAGARKDFPCFVAAPQCPRDSAWSPINFRERKAEYADDPAEPGRLALELVDELKAEFPIDPDRVYITGLSMGGFGTWDLIARHPDRFAAAVPVCGGGYPDRADAIKGVPIWAFHGAKDPVVAPALSREMVRALWEADAHPGYTEYPDVEHDSWTAAYREPNLLPWMFSKSLGKESEAPGR
jgi:predicted peptidase